MSTASAGAARRQRWLWAGALVVVLAGLSFWLWRWSRPPLPPEIALDGLEPEVEQVIRAARGAVLSEPRSAAAWGRLGQALLANHINGEATLACFLGAEHLDPDDPRWPYCRAGALVNLGRPQEALPGLRRAVELTERTKPPNAAPRLFLAEVLVSLQEEEAAERSFRQVLAKEPGNARARLGLGLLACSAQDWKAARPHLEACLGSPHARKKASAQLAAVCRRLGDEGAARKYSDLAARLPQGPDWPDPYIAEYAHLTRKRRERYRLAEQLEAQGRYAEAARLVGALVDDYPDEYLPASSWGGPSPVWATFPRGRPSCARPGTSPRTSSRPTTS